MLKQTISSIIPTPTLADLSNSQLDIDNDIHILLEWIQPFPKIIDWRVVNNTEPPSQRVKSAIRSCIKDDANQIGFMKLYINTINIEFHKFFKDNLDHFTFVDYYQLIEGIIRFYGHYIENMKLNALTRDLFQRNLNSLFRLNLCQSGSVLSMQTVPIDRTTSHDVSHFSQSLLIYLQTALSSLVPHPIADVISLLYSINFNNEVNYILIKLSIQKIKKFILTNCSGVWNKPLLSLINEFIQHEIYPNFSMILKCSSPGEIDDIYLYELIKIAHDELVSIRINEIFDLILEFPKSMHGLEELHQCLVQKSPEFSAVSNLSKFSYLTNYSLKTQSYQRAKLVNTFISICNKTLLHAGSNTIDVITTYTKTIKSFLLIDPKGVLLDKVVRPIRLYLKTREDIIVKLVHGLLDEDDKLNQLIELVRELRSTKSKKSKRKDDSDITWHPDPIDALPDFKKGKVTDIIESLISIFDSKEIFIDEFTTLFGDKLVNLHNYDISDIDTQLGFLKARFGKSEFTALDIMIKDIKDSKSINQSINGRNKTFHSSILSHLFWPTVLGNNSDHFDLPPLIMEKFELFNSEFSRYKRGRELKLVPHLGLVRLELEVKNQLFIFEVTPDKAAIISLFDDNSNELSVDHISKTLNMTPYLVSKGLAFWSQKKVLLELTKTLYMVDEDEGYEDPAMITSSSIQSAIQTTPENSAPLATDKFSILLPHLNNILQSIEAGLLEKLKGLLKLTVPKDRLDTIPDLELEKYLDHLVEENILKLSNGLYRL